MHKIIYDTILGTITEARSKAKKGTVTSKLSSTDDTPTFRETRIKKKLSFPSIPMYNNESDESTGNSVRLIHLLIASVHLLLIVILFYISS